VAVAARLPHLADDVDGGDDGGVGTDGPITDRGEDAGVSVDDAASATGGYA